jgi:hypothetical protein
MTLAGTFARRRCERLPAGVERRFRVDHETEILGVCHWQPEPRRCPTLVLLHGLEGSVDSSYMLGTAEKAYAAGFNAVRLNQRNCGAGEACTPSLYNSSLSCDPRAVVLELAERDRLQEIFVCGWSMGGNVILKMVGEFGASPPPALRGAAGVAPSVNLSLSADAISARENLLYEWHFVRNLKRRTRRKTALHPGRYAVIRADGLSRVRTIRQFDDAVVAPVFGYGDAEDYYQQASALNSIAQISVPTLILAAQDDTFVPVRTFEHPAIRGNPNITVVTPEYGGHCAFISRFDGEERFWAEARIVEFCLEHSEVKRP